MNCRNCGKQGHSHKKCFIPITSIGIICEYKGKFLMVRRKDSFAYSEFVKADFNPNNTEYLLKILSNITFDEYNFLKKTKDPEKIWKKLWISDKLSNTKKIEFELTKKKLEFLIMRKYNNLHYLLNQVIPIRKEPEWGFPKGRRFKNETDIQTAIREFKEETNIPKPYYKILPVKPYIEIFTGSNNIAYKHIYYLAKLTEPFNLEINKNNKSQLYEIGDIKWFCPKRDNLSGFSPPIFL